MFTTECTEDTEVKTESAYVCGGIRIQTLTQSIIFISFMNFMVKCIALCLANSQVSPATAGCLCG